MLDIRLNEDGDIAISKNGDISTMLGAENYQKLLEKQLIEVAPLAYMRGRTLDDAFIILDEAQNIKNPNTIKIKTLVRDEILKVKEVKAATVTSVDYNPAKRTATFRYTVTVGEDTFREEVTLYG